VEDAADYRKLTVEQARQRAAGQGWSLVRELEPGEVTTMEYRSDRLNLTVREGRVERAWVG
jgi:hypothetical protein